MPMWCFHLHKSKGLYNVYKHIKMLDQLVNDTNTRVSPKYHHEKTKSCYISLSSCCFQWLQGGCVLLQTTQKVWTISWTDHLTELKQNKDPSMYVLSRWAMPGQSHNIMSTPHTLKTNTTKHLSMITCTNLLMYNTVSESWTAFNARTPCPFQCPSRPSCPSRSSYIFNRNGRRCTRFGRWMGGGGKAKDPIRAPGLTSQYGEV